MRRDQYIGDHGVILQVYISKWAYEVLTRVATEKGVEIEELIDNLAENAALDESTISERQGK